MSIPIIIEVYFNRFLMGITLVSISAGFSEPGIKCREQWECFRVVFDAISIFHSQEFLVNFLLKFLFIQL